MAIQKSVLENGITLVTDPLSEVRSITLGFWYNVGSRDERPDQAGLTHFMEHMMFKGTPNRSALEVSEAFDKLGAESNAFTSKEYTCYYARFVDDKLPEVLPLLAEIVVDPALRDSDIETEREVVIEEIARCEDQPDDYVFELFSNALLPTHPLGRPILGTRELVGGYGHEQCQAFHDEHYHTGNLVVAAAGHVDHDDLKEQLLRAVEGIRTGDKRKRARIAELKRSDFAFQTRETEQAHVVYGFPWFEAGSPDRFTGSLLSALLGGSMSSRLFQEVREKRGLAYSVYAGASAHFELGKFYVYCGTRPDNLGEAVSIIRRELARIAETAPTADEVARTCEVICGHLLMGMESTSARMQRLGRLATVGLDLREIDEVVGFYRAVTPEDVRSLAERYLTQEPTAAVISPFTGDEARKLVFG